MPCHFPSLVSKARWLSWQAGFQSAAHPISLCRLPATVTLPTDGFGNAVVTVTGALVTVGEPGSSSTAR